MEKNNFKNGKILSFLRGLISKLKPSGKLKNIIVFGLIVIVALIFLSSFTSTKTTVSKTDNEKKVYTNCSALEYCEVLENKLENVLSSVKGISDIKVFITITESPKIEYLKESSSTQTTEGQKTITQTEEIIYTQKIDGDSKPVEIRQVLPEIEAVLIVAKGADIKMQTMITNIVSSVLSVSVSKVEVMEGK